MSATKRAARAARSLSSIPGGISDEQPGPGCGVVRRLASQPRRYSRSQLYRNVARRCRWPARCGTRGETRSRPTNDGGPTRRWGWWPRRGISWWRLSRWRLPRRWLWWRISRRRIQSRRFCRSRRRLSLRRLPSISSWRHRYAYRPYFHRHHHFHRRFYYAPSYYYPNYDHPDRHCRTIWTYYGPRRICRYRPWGTITPVLVSRTAGRETNRRPRGRLLSIHHVRRINPSP